MKTPSPEFFALLGALGPGEKIKVPNTKKELLDLRTRFQPMENIPPIKEQIEYIDSLMEAERNGTVEFLPEPS